jgi:hypothetical protein
MSTIRMIIQTTFRMNKISWQTVNRDFNDCFKDTISILDSLFSVWIGVFVRGNLFLYIFGSSNEMVVESLDVDSRGWELWDWNLGDISKGIFY